MRVIDQALPGLVLTVSVVENFPPHFLQTLLLHWPSGLGLVLTTREEPAPHFGHAIMAVPR
nr:hypothetical protein [Methylohalobius crimeensis]